MPSGAPTNAAEGSPAVEPFAVVTRAPAGAGPPPALAIASSASSTVTYLGANLSPPHYTVSTHTKCAITVTKSGANLSPPHDSCSSTQKMHTASTHATAMCVLLTERLELWQSGFVAHVEAVTR